MFVYKELIFINLIFTLGTTSVIHKEFPRSINRPKIKFGRNHFDIIDRQKHEKSYNAKKIIHGSRI